MTKKNGSIESKSILEEAMEAHGIKKEHILDSKNYDKHVVIVTKGGYKIKHPGGSNDAKLTKYQLTGIR